MTPDAVSRTRPNAPNFENFWMPFTANRQFKESPRLLVSGEGMNYTSIDGKPILDGMATVDRRSSRRSNGNCERSISLQPSRWVIR